MIQYDDFKKLDLRVAKVLAAVSVEGSDKLIRLELDAGDITESQPLNEGALPERVPRKRQIVAGIGKKYSAEELIGKSIIIVANLEPRSLMGHLSEGMLLAANADGPVVLTPEKEVPPGSKIS